MTKKLNPHPLGLIVYNEYKSILSSQYQPTESLTCKHAEYLIEGIDVSIDNSNGTSHVSIMDIDYNIHICWLIFTEGLPKKIVSISSQLPLKWCGEYQWNHITTYKNRIKPTVSISQHISRNAWLHTHINPDLKGFTQIAAQMLVGPVHLVSIAKPGSAFPVKSFKEIGDGEVGGIKFRVDELEYVLFQLEDSNLKIAPYPIPTDAGIAILRYANNELEGYWYITNRRQKAWCKKF
ncbi:MAG: hypothetical protein HQK65_19810 [Desulfamplus sp.]|nr:hypothetical protein [Desulfamplus sp.]